MRKSLGTVALTLMLGILIGAICSELIGLFLAEDSVAEQLFVNYISFGPEVNHEPHRRVRRCADLALVSVRRWVGVGK